MSQLALRYRAACKKYRYFLQVLCVYDFSYLRVPLASVVTTITNEEVMPSDSLLPCLHD